MREVFEITKWEKCDMLATFIGNHEGLSHFEEYQVFMNCMDS